MMFTQSLVRYRTIQSCRTARWSHAASSICSRTRWNSTQAAPAVDGPKQTETNKAEVTMRRFWKTVGLDQRGDSYAVTLDGRAIKSPSGNTLLVPAKKRLLAATIATEWDNAETLLKPHTMPMTSIVARATDAMSDKEARSEVEKSLLAYFETDTVCFFDENFARLDKLQKELWVPLIEWAKKEFDVEINISKSVLSPVQPQATKDKFREIMSKLDAWELAALERATLSTKSLIIGLAVIKKHLSVEQAAKTSTVEVDAQIQVWGEVEDTHDVDYQDIRRQLGSVALTLSHEP